MVTRILGIGALLLALAPIACATSRPQSVALSPAEREATVRQRGVDPEFAPDPLAYSRQMQDTARGVAGDLRSFDALDALQRYLFGMSDDPFAYAGDDTLLAIEAFERKRGNCVAITNLFIAMARSLDIPVQPALVLRRGGEEREGDLLVVRNHIVAWYRDGQESRIYDFYLSRSGPPVGIQPIDDLWAAAVYLNNYGGRALRDGDAERAAKYFETALRLAPTYGPVYSNLGVARKRKGDLEGALDAYLLALQVTTREELVKGNLLALFEEMNRVEPSFREGRSEYDTLLGRARRSFLAGAVRRAIRLYREAAGRTRNDPEPRLWIARCELYDGRSRAARRALQSALELNPDHVEARRLLDELNAVTGRQPRNTGDL